MTLPIAFTLENGNNVWVEWGPMVDGLTAGSTPPTYINDLTVTAKLYLGRDPNNAAATPGTLVASFGSGGTLALPYVTLSNGIYRGLSLQALNTPVGTNYVMVIDAADATFQGHWEKPAQVITRQS